jgi:hypothetical protein
MSYLVPAATVAEWVLGAGVTTENTTLALIHAAIEDMLSHELGRDLVEQAVTAEKYDGYGRSRIYLIRTPVTALAKVEIEDYGVIDSDYYHWTADGTLTYDYGVFPVGTQNIWVDYTGGYTTTTFPASLKVLVCRFCDEAYNLKATGMDSISSYSYGRARKDLDKLYSQPGVQGILKNFRRVMVGS